MKNLPSVSKQNYVLAFFEVELTAITSTLHHFAGRCVIPIHTKHYSEGGPLKLAGLHNRIKFCQGELELGGSDQNRESVGFSLSGVQLCMQKISYLVLISLSNMYRNFVTKAKTRHPSALNISLALQMLLFVINLLKIRLHTWAAAPY